jgi:hypothetical protein
MELNIPCLLHYPIKKTVINAETTIIKLSHYHIIELSSCITSNHITTGAIYT